MVSIYVKTNYRRCDQVTEDGISGEKVLVMENGWFHEQLDIYLIQVMKF